MKWPSIVIIFALALLSNACEMHKASELAEEKPGSEEAAATKEGAPAESADKEKKAEDGKPGEAPKFFPEKK